MNGAAITNALGHSALPAGVEVAGASLLVGGIVLFDTGLTVNWLQEVEDAFAEGSVGNTISTLGTPLVLLGTGIFLYGVVVAG